jgi:hypothetical protein
MSKHEKTAIAPSAPDAGSVRQEPLHTLTTTCPPDRDLPDPASLSLEELAPIVIEGVRKLRLYRPYILAFLKKFQEAQRDSKNRLKVPVKGCYTFQEFCRKHLGKSPQAVYALAKEIGEETKRLNNSEKPKLTADSSDVSAKEPATAHPAPQPISIPKSATFGVQDAISDVCRRVHFITAFMNPGEKLQVCQGVIDKMQSEIDLISNRNLRSEAAA